MPRRRGLVVPLDGLLAFELAASSANAPRRSRIWVSSPARLALLREWAMASSSRSGGPLVSSPLEVRLVSRSHCRRVRYMAGGQGWGGGRQEVT